MCLLQQKKTNALTEKESEKQWSGAYFRLRQLQVGIIKIKDFTRKVFCLL